MMRKPHKLFLLFFFFSLVFFIFVCFLIPFCWFDAKQQPEAIKSVEPINKHAKLFWKLEKNYARNRKLSQLFFKFRDSFFGCFCWFVFYLGAHKCQLPFNAVKAWVEEKFSAYFPCFSLPALMLYWKLKESLSDQLWFVWWDDDFCKTKAHRNPCFSKAKGSRKFEPNFSEIIDFM